MNISREFVSLSSNWGKEQSAARWSRKVQGRVVLLEVSEWILSGRRLVSCQGRLPVGRRRASKQNGAADRRPVALYRLWNVHHQHQHSHAAWTLIKTTAQIRSTHNTETPERSNLFRTHHFYLLSSAVREIVLLMENLFKFAQIQPSQVTQAGTNVEPQSAPTKVMCLSWVSACPRLSKYPSGSARWLSATNSKQCF